jgi:hypothetical protein
LSGLISDVLARLMPLRTHFGPDLRGQNYGVQISHTHQIVGSTREGEDPIYLAYSTMSQLAQQRNRLQPAEAFFDTLPLRLADGIARVPGRSPINGTTAGPFIVLGYMRRNVQVSALGHKPGRVKALVPTYRDLVRNESASRYCPANTTFHGPLFRSCSYFFMFRPPSLFASRIVPTAANSLAGQLRRLHPS